jgi:hypothetical protein
MEGRGQMTYKETEKPKGQKEGENADKRLKRKTEHVDKYF